MKRVVWVALLVAGAAQAQDPSSVSTSTRAAAAPCWIPLGKAIVVDAGRIVSFRKASDGTGNVYVDVSGASFLTTIDTGMPSKQDAFINQQRLAIAACFGDQTEGMGPGLGTK